jgi:TolB-like protein
VAQQRVQRRLAAILAADVAGYSRLMHHDEEATHAQLSALLADGVEPVIAEHGGRIVKNTGDGFLAEFPSAVEAVRAAVQFQRRVQELTIKEVEDRRIALRVGVNVGDVIVAPDDIFGDGVNIAARLERIAEPGGICISSSVHDQVRGRVGLEFTDLGEQNLKNIAAPVRAYAVIGDGSHRQRERARLVPHSPPRLSIVVLPFANVSGDPEHDCFVDGLTESLITDLSRMRDAFVISRNSAFAYNRKAIDVRRVGRELNARYVLEGSVQRSDTRVRVNVQLVDAETASHLWAERFDKPIAELLDMQDEIVSRLVNTLRCQLVVAEARRAERSQDPDVMDLLFQAKACFCLGINPKHLTQARDFCERALAIDHRSVGALVGISTVEFWTGASLLTDDPAECFSEAEANAMKALSLAPDDAAAHAALGAIYICTNRATKGISEYERALQLDRNLATAHGAIGLAKSLLGQPAEMERHISDAFRLSPGDTNAHLWMHFLGEANMMIGADANAVGWLRRSIEANRNFPLAHLMLAAVLASTGARDEARNAARAGLALSPGVSIRRILLASAFSANPTYLNWLDRICEGANLAGVPEG